MSRIASFVSLYAPLVAVLGSITPAQAQPDCLGPWTEIASAPSGFGFAPRVLVHDALRATTVVVGRFGSVSEWNGIAWQQFGIGTIPVNKGLQAATLAIAYDSARGLTLVADHKGLFFSWNGVVAESLPDVPPGTDFNVLARAFAFDSNREVLVSFGGLLLGTGFLDETWEWDGLAWTQRFPKTSPPPMSAHAMAFDPIRGVVVLFGGQFVDDKDDTIVLNQTWEYDGTTWTDRTDLLSPTPTARASATMTFHTERGVVVLAGGDAADGTDLFDLWEWDGQGWTQRMPEPPTPFAAQPAVVYESARRNLLAIHRGGGSAAWTLPEPQPGVMSPVNQTVVAGQPVQFLVEAGGDFPLAYQWRFNGTPIEGATLRSLTIGNATMADVGAYDVVVGFDGFEPFGCPTVVSAAAMLNVVPAVPGDTDGDGDFDLEDLANLLDGFTGPEM